MYSCGWCFIINILFFIETLYDYFCWWFYFALYTARNSIKKCFIQHFGAEYVFSIAQIWHGMAWLCQILSIYPYKGTSNRIDSCVMWLEKSAFVDKANDGGGGLHIYSVEYKKPADVNNRPILFFILLDMSPLCTYSLVCNK